MKTNSASNKISVVPPEIIDWATIGGFTYTYRPKRCESNLDIRHVKEILETRVPELTVDDLRGRLKVCALGADQNECVHRWALHACLEFECIHKGNSYILLAGDWFVIDRSFAAEVRNQIRGISTGRFSLPEVVESADGLSENESQYNERVCSGNAKRFVLFDRDLIRCTSIPTPIEFCDLLTSNSEIVHVKFRKGGTTGLSHLFSQAYVSALTMKRDAGFREGVRRKLFAKGGRWRSLVSKTGLVPQKYTIVMAILGANPSTAASELSFFAQLNLLRTYRGLSEMGFNVKVIGVPMQST